MIGENKYKFSTAFEKICELVKSIRILQGGKGSSKTISILEEAILIAMSNQKDVIYSIVAETLPNLKKGALRDFEKILKDWNIFYKFKRNKTEITYEYTTDILDGKGEKIGENTNIIEFFSVEGEGSKLGSRRTHLYVNEADMIKFSTFIELQGRTSVQTTIDYNPRRKFWAHKELIGEPHVDFMILNFTHNEFIPREEKNSIIWYKKKADEGSKYFLNKWRVLGLGELGITEGVIFENWVKGDSIPKDAKYLGACVDWGFSPDPATVTKLYRYDGKIYIYVSFYKRKQLNSNIANHIIADPEIMSGIVVADSSEPKSIAELSSYGIPIEGARDKRILSGIALMQEFEFVVVGKEAVEEFENYCYKQNKSGESLGVPVDDWNHIIDPVRYFIVDNLANSAIVGNVLKFMK